jgi:hypothetical protein
MNTTPFNAHDARKLADIAVSLNGTFKRKETNDLLEYIKTEAERGSDGITVTEEKYMHTVIVQRLVALGFDAKIKSGQCDGDYLTIKW